MVYVCAKFCSEVKFIFFFFVYNVVLMLTERVTKFEVNNFKIIISFLLFNINELNFEI